MWLISRLALVRRPASETVLEVHHRWLHPIFCLALSFPGHLALIGLGGVVMGLGIRYTTASCSSAAYWVGQLVVGGRSVFRLDLLLHRQIPPMVFDPLHARRRVSPPLPAAATGYASGGLHGLASSHGRGRQLSRGCMVDDLACPDPGDGLGASRWSRLVV